MYALQYGEFLYFSETSNRLYDTDPDIILKIDNPPSYGSGYSMRIDPEKMEIVPVKLNEEIAEQKKNIFEDAINQI